MTPTICVIGYDLLQLDASNHDIVQIAGAFTQSDNTLIIVIQQIQQRPQAPMVFDFNRKSQDMQERRFRSASSFKVVYQISHVWPGLLPLECMVSHRRRESF